MANPPGAAEEETQEAKQQATAQATETPDYPESPAPPHLEPPLQQRARQLAGLLEPPPLGQKLPHNSPRFPSYNNRTLDHENTTPVHLCRLFFWVV